MPDYLRTGQLAYQRLNNQNRLDDDGDVRRFLLHMFHSINRLGEYLEVVSANDNTCDTDNMPNNEIPVLINPPILQHQQQHELVAISNSTRLLPPLSLPRFGLLAEPLQAPAACYQNHRQYRECAEVYDRQSSEPEPATHEEEDIFVVPEPGLEIEVAFLRLEPKPVAHEGEEEENIIFVPEPVLEIEVPFLPPIVDVPEPFWITEENLTLMDQPADEAVILMWHAEGQDEEWQGASSVHLTRLRCPVCYKSIIRYALECGHVLCVSCAERADDGQRRSVSHMQSTYVDAAIPIPGINYGEVSKVKGTKWQWKEDEAKAFQAVKELFIREVVLMHPIPGRPYILQTDNSGYGIGGVLAQEDERGEVDGLAEIQDDFRVITDKQREDIRLNEIIVHLTRRTAVEDMPVHICRIIKNYQLQNDVLLHHDPFHRRTTIAVPRCLVDRLIWHYHWELGHFGPAKVYATGKEVAETAREQLRRKTDQRRRGQARRGGRIVRFRVGDWVLLKTNPVANPLQKITPKFCLLYEGPYEISANPFPNAYALIYCGQDKVDGMSVATKVVLELMEQNLDKGLTLYTDNWYTSIELALKLRQRNTHLVGTLRKDRKGVPKEVVKLKLQKGDIIGRDKNVIVVLKWKDKRDVLILSTKHTDEMVEIPSRDGTRLKPKAVMDYNTARSYIHLSDQMSSYSTSIRRSIKWFKKLP
ncbi:hypothetical protein CBL_20361 [Carabus blaptoides fortunei]